jgi:hypothetical protein
MMAMMITTRQEDGNGGHIGAMAMEPIVSPYYSQII